MRTGHDFGWYARLYLRQHEPPDERDGEQSDAALHISAGRDWGGETPAIVFYLYDANCNVDAIVDEDGDLAKQFTYAVFGAVRETPEALSSKRVEG